MHVSLYGNGDPHCIRKTPCTLRSYMVDEVARLINTPESFSDDISKNHEGMKEFQGIRYHCYTLSQLGKASDIYTQLKNKSEQQESKHMEDEDLWLKNQRIFALQCLFSHYQIGLQLANLAKKEAECERSLESEQIAKVAQAKKQLNINITSNFDKTIRNVALAEELKLFDDNRDDNDVNLVNLLYFHSQGQLNAAIDFLNFLGIGKTFKPNERLENCIYIVDFVNNAYIKDLDNPETIVNTQFTSTKPRNMVLNWSTVALLLAKTLSNWAAWQQEATSFSRPKPHVPSKEEEREFLDIYEMYVRSCKLFESLLVTLSLASIVHLPRQCVSNKAKRYSLERPKRVTSNVELSKQRRRSIHTIEAIEPEVSLLPATCPYDFYSLSQVKTGWDLYNACRLSMLEDWARAMDGVVFMKLQFSLPDAGSDFDGNMPEDKDIGTPFVKLLRVFLMMYRDHLSTEKNRDATRPIVALSLNEHKMVSEQAIRVLLFLEKKALSKEIRSQCSQSIHFAIKIAEAQRMEREVWLERQFDILINKIGVSSSIRKVFPIERLAADTRLIFLFRQILYFRESILLPHTIHQDVCEYNDHKKTMTQLESFEFHIARQARQRRYSSIARTISLKLESANVNVADALFAPLVVEKNMTKYFKDFAVIGHGAFGEVFVASVINKYIDNDLRFNNRIIYRKDEAVAIKKISLNLPLRDLKKEVCTLQMCQHPNIVGYRATYSHDGHLWVVMEFCDGGTLESLAEGNQCDEQTIAQFCRGILNGLSYFHNNINKVHRDIKPENIFLTAEGEVKLGDLGFCMDTSYETRHKRNSIAGTARYLAPEMINKYGYNSKIDIWSFGCLVYFMIEGVDVHNSLRSMDAMLRVATIRDITKSDSFSKLSPCSLELRHFLQMCLAFNPARRWTAIQLLDHPFLTGNKPLSANAMRSLMKTAFLNKSLNSAGFT